MLDFIKRYRQSINPPYSFKDYLNLTVTFLFLLILPVGLYLSTSNSFPDIRSKAAPPAASKPSESKPQTSFSSNELLVKIKKGPRSVIRENSHDTGIPSLNGINKQLRVKSFERVAQPGKGSNKEADVFGWYKVTLDIPHTLIRGKLEKVQERLRIANPANSNARTSETNPAFDALAQLIAKYELDPSIETLEPNYQATIDVVPNDPYYSSSGAWGQLYPDLWGLHKINMEAAWDSTTGSTSVIVAGIDTGVDRNHPDIQSQMWVNANETAGNGVDDDGNGYIDDYFGCNFINMVNNTCQDPMDDHGHGTHTVGTIAATGNNSLGVVGLNWRSKIMALKFLDSSGSGDLSNGVKALAYAADMGARVSSNSWGCDCASQAIDDAVAYEHNRGMVIAVAAGNSNADAITFSPADSDYAITVAASDPNDAKASFSNWGEKIDVAAPGVNILSIRAANNPMCTPSRTIGTNYCFVSGTSMATPHVAGLAALMLSQNPQLTNEEIRQLIRSKATDLGATGKDAEFGYGRIDAGTTVAATSTHPLTPVITAPGSRTKISGTSSQIYGIVGGPNFASYKVEMGAGRVPTSWVQIATGTSQPASNTLLATINTTSYEEGLYIIRLTATDTAGKTFQFQVLDIEIDNFDAAINFPQGLVSVGSITVVGTAQTKNTLPFGNYKLEWAPQSSPSSWSASGISLTGNGTQPVLNNTLGTWNTSTLADGQSYQLRLTVTSVGGSDYQIISTIKVDKDIVNGWPKFYSNPSLCYCTPGVTFSDLNGDGTNEVIIPAPDGRLYGYRKDGSSMPGFPSFQSGTDYYDVGNVTIDDLDNDGKKEIVSVVSSGSRVYITRSDGTPYPGWPNLTVDVQHRVPTVADLDNDGKKDIVALEVITWTIKTDVILHAYHLNGTELAGFPRQYTLPPIGLGNGTIFPSNSSGLSIADLDHDGNLEIAWSYSNYLYLFDRQGNILPGWPYMVPLYNNKIMVFESPFASGDIDGDGNLELFIISTAACDANDYVCYIGSDTVFYGFKKDASLVAGWPKNNQTDGIINGNYYGYGVPSFADIDNDAKDEIAGPFQGLAIFDFEGKRQLSNAPGMYIQPALADVTGDGIIDYIGARDGSITISQLNGAQFNNYWQRNIYSTTLPQTFYTPIVLADLDNNGKIELGAVSRDMGISTTNNTLNSQAYLWEIPTTNPPHYEWPMFSHDSARTGRLIVSSQPTPFPTAIISPTPTISVPSSTPTLAPNPTSTPNPLTITFSNIQSTNTTTSQATITWTTNVAGTTKVLYGTTLSNLNLSTTENPGLVTAHSVTLSGLSKNTRYYYKAVSKNSQGTEFSSNTFNFRTKNK